MSAPTTAAKPVVLRDPRFEAGRALIEQGMAHEGAIEIFSTLVEECVAKHGDSSVETSPAFFEYGNALLRAYLVTSSSFAEDEGTMNGRNDEEVRKAAAEAAEARQTQAQTTAEDQEPAAVSSETSIDKGDSAQQDGEEEENNEENEEEADEDDGNNDDETDDLKLSLEMMENAFSIMDDYQTSTDSGTERPYVAWIKEQMPRVLLGIGDCLSALQRHADAADTYSRALDCRQVQLEKLVQSERTSESLAQLVCQRRVCEATVLIAEELLACPKDQDVVTTETQSLIVAANERIEYARGYYDKARDSLQDTVFLLGKLASKNVDLGTEKEDVCFLATMVMGVGETLAALDEQEAEKEPASEPAKKKAKR